jgi:hypothetical protein
MISSLKSRFGEDVRITTLLDGGVLPGIVGCVGWGVSCLDGVAGFLTGVPLLGLDLGVVEFRASTLLRRPLPRKAARLGLPVSDAIVCTGADTFGGELAATSAWNGELPRSVSNSMTFFARARFPVLGWGLRMPPTAVVISIPTVASISPMVVSVIEGMIPPMAAVISMVTSPAVDSKLSRFLLLCLWFGAIEDLRLLVEGFPCGRTPPTTEVNSIVISSSSFEILSSGVGWIPPTAIVKSMVSSSRDDASPDDLLRVL